MSFIEFVKDKLNYENRKIGRIEPEENNGIGVSTAYTSDEGYETALLDTNGVHPVERYKTLLDAQQNHQKWIDFAKNGNGKSITELGWTEFGMDKKIILEAKEVNKQ